MRSACLLQDLMGNQSGTVCGNTLSNTLSHFRSHEGGHLHSYWARRSDVLGLSSHIQIYVHKGLYNTNLCAQRLVYINIIMCMCTCAYNQILLGLDLLHFETGSLIVASHFGPKLEVHHVNG